MFHKIQVSRRLRIREEEKDAFIRILVVWRFLKVQDNFVPSVFLFGIDNGGGGREREKRNFSRITCAGWLGEDNLVLEIGLFARLFLSRWKRLGMKKDEIFRLKYRIRVVGLF